MNVTDECVFRLLVETHFLTYLKNSERTPSGVLAKIVSHTWPANGGDGEHRRVSEKQRDVTLDNNDNYCAYLFIFLFRKRTACAVTWPGNVRAHLNLRPLDLKFFNR